jgi:ubiquinone/menaquinone biosynthesis C-methylase UbiE
MEADEAERIYDQFAEAYRDWWGPIIAPASVQVLDDVEVPAGDSRPFDLLDIGTGTGVLAVGALRRWPGVRVVALDPSSEMLELATDAARAAGQADRLRAVTSSADRIPLADASTDVAVSSFVIQLVPDRPAVLREVLRVLRPGSRFACLTWQDDALHFPPDDAFSDALDELQIIPPPDDRDVDPYEDPSQAEKEFRSAGFVEIRAEQVWVEHRFTPEEYLDLLQHWIERETFAGLDAESQRQLRGVALREMRALSPGAFLWRRPLVHIVARRPRR